jgi:hypothetical protein
VAGGVGSVVRGGRLRVGVEGGVSGGKLDSQRPRLSVVQKTRSYDFHAGCEYLVAGDLAARAGYQRRSHDYAVGQPASLGLANGLTLGFGYLPRGGLVAIDTFIRVWKERPDVAGATDRQSEESDLGVSARLLF